MSIACLNCSAVTAGSGLCSKCTHTTSRALARIAESHAELPSIGTSTSRTRRGSTRSDPTGAAVVRSESPTERPDDPDVAAATTKAQLVGWCMVLLDERGVRLPADSVRAMTEHLRRRLSTISTCAWAGDFVTEILELEQQLRRIVARASGRWYAGRCSNELRPERTHDGASCLCACHATPDATCDVPGGCHPEVDVIPAEYCERELFAEVGSSTVWCRDCRQTWDLASRRRFLLDEAREALLPLHQVANTVVQLMDTETSTPRLAARLHKRVTRGQLQHRSVVVIDGRPVRLYRVGDVIDTLAVTEPSSGVCYCPRCPTRSGVRRARPLDLSYRDGRIDDT